jgi:hypothetical protein
MHHRLLQHEVDDLKLTTYRAAPYPFSPTYDDHSTESLSTLDRDIDPLATFDLNHS